MGLKRISKLTPVNIGVANAIGAIPGNARVDHVHNHPAGLGTDLHHNEDHGAAQHADVTRYKFYPVPTQVGDSPARINVQAYGVNMTDGNNLLAALEGKIPSGFVSIVSVQPVIIALGDGDLVWRLESYYASNGQVRNVHNEVPGVVTTNVAAFDITELPDQSGSIFLALVEADYFALQFTRRGDLPGDTVDADVHYLGVLVGYTAEQ